MKAAARIDGIRELGPFCRALVEWAFPHFLKAKSLSMLKKSKMEYAKIIYARAVSENKNAAPVAESRVHLPEFVFPF